MEFLNRESSSNSLLAVPKSFYEKNKDYIEKLGLKNTGLQGSNSRRLRFELEKKEIEKDYYKRMWINTLLVNSNEMLKNFNLERTNTYWDQNLHCIKGEAYSDAKEVHAITGHEDGIDKKAAKKCEDREEKKKIK